MMMAFAGEWLEAGAVSPRFLLGAALVAALTTGAASAQTPQETPPPRILLDQSPVAIDYQLRRLSDEQLVRVERRADDRRYAPVYLAIARRPGVAAAAREEAVAALMTLQAATRTTVLFEILAPLTDDVAAAPLLRMLLAQPLSDLAAVRVELLAAANWIPSEPGSIRFEGRQELLPAATSDVTGKGLFLALMLADQRVDPAWTLAQAHPAHRIAVLEGIAYLPATPAADALRRDLAPRVAAVVATPASDDEYVAAVTAVAATRRDGEAFTLLADVVSRGRTAAAVAAAVDGLSLIPAREWAASAIEPLVTSIITRTAALSTDERAAREAIDAIGLADRLAGALPAGRARALRSELRALGVRVVRIEAKPEQVAFDLRWFVVEAGKPVQIVFFNPDAMPHNVVVGAPGALELIGTLGGAMPMPTDPAVKPFVPDVPQVLAATPLVTQGNTDRLGFVAPTTPGEYVFVCTFPGHWVRMYGVMLVVPSLDAWEATPTVPTDPMTKQPFASQRTE